MEGDGFVAGIPSSSETPAVGNGEAAVSALFDALTTLAAERSQCSSFAELAQPAPAEAAPCTSFAELAQPAPAEAAAPNPSQEELTEAKLARLVERLQADVGHRCRGDAGSSDWPPPSFGSLK